MPYKPYRPRLSVELTEEQFLKLQKLLPWGLQRALFSEIVDDLIRLLETNGEMVIAAIVGRAMQPRECIQSLKEVSNKVNEGGSKGGGTEDGH